MARCSVCGNALDKLWVEMGVKTHPACDVVCPHGTPRGPAYCALCRRDLGKPIGPRKPVDANVAPVSLDHPMTSHGAASRVLPSTGTKRRLVYDALIEAGTHGLCDFEIEARFRWKHESASACRRSLVVDGWVENSGRTRDVPDTGNAAIVWIARRET